MFTVNKSWTFEGTGCVSACSCSQRSDTPSHTSPDIQWKLLSVSLDPAESKSSIGWKERCGFGKKSAYCPVWRARDQNKLPPGRGANFSVMLRFGSFAGVMNEHILKRAITLQKQTGHGEKGWKGKILGASSSVAFKEHEQESPLSRYVFPGKKKQKKPSKYEQWHSHRGLLVFHFYLQMKSRDIW